MKIYTKTGDDGTTALFEGTRVKKHDIRVEAYGTVDELNAHVGLLRDLIENSELKSQLLNIQNTLFRLGSILATETTPSASFPKIEKTDTKELETEIDKLNAPLPPMTHFIIPGGHPTISQCHIARCICRNAERRITQLSENQTIDTPIRTYINRLSDYLFVLARHLSMVLKIEEIKWIPKPT